MSKVLFQNSDVTLSRHCGPRGMPMVQITNDDGEFVAFPMAAFLQILGGINVEELFVLVDNYESRQEG